MCKHFNKNLKMSTSGRIDQSEHGSDTSIKNIKGYVLI